jgi:hypothetical protein
MKLVGSWLMRRVMMIRIMRLDGIKNGLLDSGE